MTTARTPLLPVGLLLVLLGLGNWYTGHDKTAEHEQLLLNNEFTAPVAEFSDFPELNARTTATLLSSLQRGSDRHSIVATKLDFYKVVQSGGRILVLIGLFCTAAGLIRSWHRQRVIDRNALAPSSPSSTSG